MHCKAYTAILAYACLLLYHVLFIPSCQFSAEEEIELLLIKIQFFL
jgi:hypothetical protein